jgi:hypothetical protein
MTVTILSTLQKALLVANARVAVINGAERTWCVGGDFVCDIPGYDGYEGTPNGLDKACEDLGVQREFLEHNGVTKVHVSTALGSGAVMGLTIPLPEHEDRFGDSVLIAVIAVLQLHYMVHHNKLKGVPNLIDDLAHIFDVSFGTGS